MKTSLPRMILATIFMTLPVFAQKPAESELTKCTIYARCDDEGEIFVNGVSVLKAPKFDEVFQIEFPLTKGDVVTATVKDKQGGPGGFWTILILRDGKPWVTVKDFSYTTAPDPDWQKSPSLTGFKAPRMQTLKDFSIGNVRNPQAAWSVNSDRNFATLHFKCVLK